MSLDRLRQRFESPAIPGAPDVEDFRLEEALDAPYHLDVELDVGSLELDPSEVLGRDAVFVLERAPLSRRLAGVIHTVREGARRADGGATVSVRVVPALSLLALRHDTRMFQEQTVPEILEAVLGEGLADYGRAVRVELDETYPRREYCLQYQESDLAFVSRLMEEEGIYYTFDHQGDVELLVLRDRNGAAEAAPAATEGIAPFQASSLPVETVEPVHRLHRAHHSVTTQVSLRDRDWTSAAMIVRSERPGEDDRGRVRESYEHGEGRSLTIGSYAQGVRRYQQNDASRQATLRQEAHGAEQLVGAGLGRVIGFAPGTRFRLVGHPGAGIDDEYLITRVIHVSEEAEELRDGGGAEEYHNRFECVPMAVPHRPARRTPKPRIPSIQTAIVTGPAGEEIHTDEWGRVKVRFHWDRENPADDTSSVWVRVQQAWVGRAWGSLFIPRIGVEVVVAFVDGDPDRPVVTGCLYNGNNPPPYDLPADKTKSTLKSNSTPGGGGFNEIRFEDRAGSEEIFVHSQKDTNKITNNCETNTVGVDQTITIGVNQVQSIGVDQVESVGANQTLTVGANRVITVGATFTESIGASSTITVNGHATETLNAGETQTVNAGRTETVNGGETRTVNGGQTETINGGATQTINGGITQSITGSVTESFVGDHTNTTTGSLTHTITGGATVFTPASFNLVAVGGYNLVCPAGGTVISPGGWTVIAPAGQTWLESVTTTLVGTVTETLGLQMKLKAISLAITGVNLAATGLELSVTGVKIENQAVKLKQVSLETRICAIRAYVYGPRLGTSGIHVYL